VQQRDAQTGQRAVGQLRAELLDGVQRTSA
jgi:hypothetical protein